MQQHIGDTSVPIPESLSWHFIATIPFCPTFRDCTFFWETSYSIFLLSYLFPAATLFPTLFTWSVLFKSSHLPLSLAQSLCMTSIHIQAPIYCSLCITLRLSPGEALLSPGLMRVSSTMCVSARLYEACLSYVFGETFCFSSPHSVLNSQAVVKPPFFLFFSSSLSFCLFSPHVWVSHQVYFVLRLRLMHVCVSVKAR